MEYICNGCDKKCKITAKAEDGVLTDIRGNACGDGASYVQREYLMNGED